MRFPRRGDGPHSPYVAFKDDVQRKWALISKDVRWVAVALILGFSGGWTTQFRELWKLLFAG